MDRIHSGFMNNNVASRLASLNEIVSNNENNNPDNNAFVTELTAYHLTGKYQRPYILDILYQIETTDSISDFEQLKDQVKDYLLKMQNELMAKRDRFFVVHNNDSANVYGVLADNIKIHDRDLYIKELVSYYEIIKNLKDIHVERVEGFYSFKGVSAQPFHEMQDIVTILLDDASSGNSVRICDSSSLYGDLSAIHNLMCDMPSKVPDFIFNCGNIEVD